MTQFVDDIPKFTITLVTIVIDKYDPTSSVSSAAAAAVSSAPTDFPSLCVHVCSEGVLWGLHDNQFITNCDTTVSIFCFDIVYHCSRSDCSCANINARARVCESVCVLCCRCCVTWCTVCGLRLRVVGEHEGVDPDALVVGLVG